MVMTKTTATSLIVIGIIELVLGAIAIICGITSMSKLTSPFFTTIGIWAVYFAIPGILCIVAGISLSTPMLGICLGMNIVGIVYAVVSMGFGVSFWAILNDGTCIGAINTCVCGNDNYDADVYSASCSDLIVVRNATASATVVYILLMITTFVASIFGCIGTCCAPRDPQLIVAAVQPQAGTIVVNSNQQTVAMPSQPYPAVAHPSYTQMQRPPYDGQINLEFPGESQKNF